MLVKFREKFGGVGKCNGGDVKNVLEYVLVFWEWFVEGMVLVVDGKSGDLLDELKEVDGWVEKGGGEFGFEIDYFGVINMFKLVCE